MSERNKALARSEFEVWSTGEGDLGGAPPTGKRVTLTGTTIERFEDGKVVES